MMAEKSRGKDGQSIYCEPSMVHLLPSSNTRQHMKGRRSKAVANQVLLPSTIYSWWITHVSNSSSTIYHGVLPLLYELRVWFLFPSHGIPPRTPSHWSDTTASLIRYLLDCLTSYPYLSGPSTLHVFSIVLVSFFCFTPALPHPFSDIATAKDSPNPPLHPFFLLISSSLSLCYPSNFSSSRRLFGFCLRRLEHQIVDLALDVCRR
ncbi:unnamed protein product [Lactuca saligna]|uniref:Uncharacterized protein n=1 Tax=Lactuca saligna TaxID=75948 RepID=A0AA35UTB5_LACSI|nr:unnamed protein product [Lactuca saligna]